MQSIAEFSIAPKNYREVYKFAIPLHLVRKKKFLVFENKYIFINFKYLFSTNL